VNVYYLFCDAVLAAKERASNENIVYDEWRGMQTVADHFKVMQAIYLEDARKANMGSCIFSNPPFLVLGMSF
jgi:hypothetical protein